MTHTTADERGSRQLEHMSLILLFLFGIDISMDTNTSVTTGAVVAAVAVNASVPLQINEQHMAVDPITSKQEALRPDCTTDLNDLSIPALKERCHQRGLQISGSHSTLISRLTGICLTYHSSTPSLQNSTTDLNDLSIPALKERCRQRGLRIGGSRSTLISRLTGIPVTAPAPAAVDSTQEGAETET
ncbi:hypothetical protein PROFUN_16806, partial [Planoprotostelium fungivorum]